MVEGLCHYTSRGYNTNYASKYWSAPFINRCFSNVLIIADTENLVWSPQEASPLKTVVHNMQKELFDIFSGPGEYLKTNIGVHYLRDRNTILVHFEQRKCVGRSALLDRPRMKEFKWIPLKQCIPSKKEAQISDLSKYKRIVKFAWLLNHNTSVIEKLGLRSARAVCLKMIF